MLKTLFNPGADFQTANMLGLYKGVGAASSFALEEDMAADTPVVLGTGTDTPLLPPDLGTPMLLLSADAGNAGADIELEVLDVDFRVVTVTVLITGVGDFPILHPDTQQSFPITRVNSAKNLGGRGAGELVGDVVIHEVGTPANIYGTITALSQAMAQAIYTVPAGTVWAISSLVTSMRKSAGVDTDVSVTLIAGAVGNVLRRVYSFGLQRSGDTTLEFINSELEGSKSPVDLLLEATSSAAGASVSARITMRTVEI